jgi:glycerol kinase
MQFQADLPGIPVQRPKVIETTALGAAYLAGLATGVWRNLGELESQWQVERSFIPTMPRDRAEDLMARWERAVRQTVAT